MHVAESRPAWVGTTGPRFVERPTHRRWLLDEATRLIAQVQSNALNPAGGFSPLATDWQKLPPRPGQAGVERLLHDTTRTVHCFAIAHLLGTPGADRVIDHGMDFLWKGHRDLQHGGYFWSVDDTKPIDPTKLAYGHAFVLLAASSAKVVGHPDADRLLADVTEVLGTRFWEAKQGATSEEYAPDWQKISTYRGQNSNMHLTEATMAAFEATGDRSYLEMGENIAALIIERHAREQGWRVAEHFTENWEVDRAYSGDPMFRPAGTTPGHALEWSRLLIQLWELGGRRHDWMKEAAKRLFLNTVATGWDNRSGGFYYTLDWNDQPDQTDRFWWPCAEGIAAAATIGSVDPDPIFEEWYRRIWDFTRTHLIDPVHGGWFPELGPDLKPITRVFEGKPDLYHALQACLIPLVPTTGSVTRGLGAGVGV
ncbi:AGE family epimerase/isomerase [Mesorhizobium sp. NBSH29]|uniref:AGE family epimerase/isomerase n=1 Tax=Mesorhizobium sp. NBSH29 TaxID=2654249 RepID=UPI0018964BB7|nr:AGE family epimerase/isomerase [Mesorhizobium sp. NBSH29]QPC85708.1 AGE family epimerase/isomerase [Mesorhizobium sp. NBSH29]